MARLKNRFLIQQHRPLNQDQMEENQTPGKFQQIIFMGKTVQYSHIRHKKFSFTDYILPAILKTSKYDNYNDKKRIDRKSRKNIFL